MIKVDPMTETPTSRSEFERNANLLAEAMRDGRMNFASHLRHTTFGLRRVRSLPNGRIDLLSIDEAARLTMNMNAEMQTHRAMRPPLPDDE